MHVVCQFNSIVYSQSSWFSGVSFSSRGSDSARCPYRRPPLLLAHLLYFYQEPGIPGIYTYILNEDTHPVIRAIGVSHTACRDEFRQNLRSHSWSYFYFYNVSARLRIDKTVAIAADIGQLRGDSRRTWMMPRVPRCDRMASSFSLSTVRFTMASCVVAGAAEATRGRGVFLVIRTVCQTV